MKYLLALPLMLLMVSGAHADGLYLKGGASLANLSEFNTDNVGWSVEAGYITETSFGDLAIGGEHSVHMHLGNETQGAALNVSLYMGDWAVRPYVTGGVGMTFEGVSFGQAGGGLMWTANDDGDAGSFNIYGGYEMRCYELSNGCESRDGYAKAGIMLTF